MKMTKRSTAIGFGLAALVSAPAFAAGPVVPAPEPVVVAPVALAAPPMFHGGYVGAGIGYAFGGEDTVGVQPFAQDAGEIELGGPIANILTGYRWQQPGSRFVYGVEAQASLGNVEDDVSAVKQDVLYETEAEMKWTAALRATLGYAVRPDTLVYGFAGYSVGKSDYKITATDPLGGTETLDESRDLDGYIVGLGVERMLNDRWSVRGEYQYSNFGSDEMESENYVEGARTGFRTSDTPEYHTIRVGVNYNF